MKDFKLYIAIIFSAVILSFGMTKIIKQDRTVTVRGLSEKEVDADLVIWPLSFSVGNDDLSDLQQDIINKTEFVTDFLIKFGLDKSDYTIQAPKITDNSMNVYIDKSRIPFQYIAQQTILIRSSKIKNVKEAQENSLNLAEKEITITQEYDTRMTFEFTGLNSIKPAMIEEATNNARLAAEKFAKDSGSKVGKIKKATQGLFSIENAAVGLEEKKNVRVVTTVEYLLK